ncbi:MAG TPA: sulfite exporter TauE/SafE family protein [Acidobacteriaceae bacterium]
MTVLHFTILIALGSFAAGFLGALTGLGGGVVIVPLLALVFHVDMRYAIGASLVSVIATSSGAAAAYVREGFSNLRIGMFLEIATTVGAIAGAFIATRVSTSTIAIVFGFVLLYSAYLSVRTQPPHSVNEKRDPLSIALRLDGDYPTPQGQEHYTVHRIQLGFGLMFGAGTLSGLLGIGSGAVKVLAMDQAMRIPFKVSTTTSNFMIGVTAAASAGVYLARGYIDPGIAMPVVLGALAGSMLGAKVLVKARTKSLRIVFSLVIVGLGIEMIFNGFTGRL